MQRREVLQAVSVMLGSSMISPAIAKVLDGYVPQPRPVDQSIFSLNDKALIAEIAETIIPETGTPGAKAVGVGDFIVMILEDCYKPVDQEAFRQGLLKVEEEAKRRSGKSFLECSASEKIKTLTTIEAQAMAASKKAFSFWHSIKSLTVTGYFTSEAGTKQALEYLWVPGKYQACMEMKPGQKTWAY